jgi:DNA-binding transcriptional LysR family regulator
VVFIAVLLDQLRTFVAPDDEGSFSGITRKLLRVQAIVINLTLKPEGQFGIALFSPPS